METEKIAVKCDNEEKWSKTVCFIRKLTTPNYSYKEVVKAYSSENVCISLENGCYGDTSWYKKEGYKIISFQEFEQTYLTPKEEALKPSTPKFEVGRWYKFNSYTSKGSINYAKLENLSLDGFSTKNWIHESGGKHFNGSGYWSLSDIYNPVLVTDLSEIQQFLPEGHVDKIPIKEELTSLPEKWYIALNQENKEAIGKWRAAGYVGAVKEGKGYCLSGTGFNQGLWVNTLNDCKGYTEITYDQFLKWVIKQEKPMETKKEDWCVQITQSNREAIIEWFKPYHNGHQYSLGAYYGLYKKGQSYANPDIPLGKLLSTEQFLKKIGKDVPKKEESLVGRWLKCIKSSNFSPDIKIGQFIQIEKEEKPYWLYIKNYTGSFIRERIDKHSEFELMPVGFTPPVEEKKEERWTPNVGDWIKITSTDSYVSGIYPSQSKAKVGDIVQITSIKPEGGEATEKDPRHFGDTFNLRQKDFVKATPEEIASVTGKKESGIPEYVECIRENEYFGKKGKVYKVINWNHSDNDCLLDGSTTGSTAKERFKPSTKEAYEAQFQTKSSTPMAKFKIGDRVRVCKSEEDINGWGYLQYFGALQKIHGVANNEFTVQSVKAFEGRNYYQHIDTYYICEDCLSLISHTSTLSKEEELLENIIIKKLGIFKELV